jgi:hypothetical protein
MDFEFNRDLKRDFLSDILNKKAMLHKFSLRYENLVERECEFSKSRNTNIMMSVFILFTLILIVIGFSTLVPDNSIYNRLNVYEYLGGASLILLILVYSIYYINSNRRNKYLKITKLVEDMIVHYSTNIEDDMCNYSTTKKRGE